MSSGTETNWLCFRPCKEAEGPGDPKERGSEMVCIDAETGEEIWRLNYYGTVWGGKPVIGDSIIACLNSYDSRVYAIGKGPSATTVSASPEIATHGSKVLVKGTVTDISPGTDDVAIKKRFPNGVPAVADESMSAWMEYVYMQFSCPANVKGVEVIIEVLDPDGQKKRSQKVRKGAEIISVNRQGRLFIQGGR